MTHDDGGHAFPQCAVQFDDGGMSVTDVMPQGGISIRDYFAAAALTGINAATDRKYAQALVSAANDKGGKVIEYVASMAYSYADAMLAERAKE